MHEPKHVPGLTELVSLDCMDRHLAVLACEQNATGVQKQMEKAAEQEPGREPPRIIPRPVSFGDADRLVRLRKMIRHEAAMGHHEEVDEEARDAEWKYARDLEAFETAGKSGVTSAKRPERPKTSPERRRGAAVPCVFSRGMFRWVVAQLKDAKFDRSVIDYVPHLYAAFGICTEDADLDLPAACFASDAPANPETKT